MEESEDVYDFDNDGIVSKFNISTEDEVLIKSRKAFIHFSWSL